VPPLADTVTVVEPPKQEIDPGVDDAITILGAVTAVEAEVLQPLASVVVAV
jgi:hypothetical protein